MRIVGRGGFGVVKMVQAKEGSIKGTRYALKCVSKKLAVEQKQQKALANERNILAELDHPFIIKFVRSFHGPSFVYFLMELVTGGELLDALDELGLLKRSQAQFYVASITLALEFLHERRIAYLDLKGENCLIDSHGYLKMVDFGIAERVKNGRIYAVKGTPLTMAPEVILGKGYTTTADLWGLGVCLYDFMLGKFPFSDDSASKTEVFRAVLKAPLAFPKWLNKSQDTKSLLEGLLCRDPAKRPGAGPDGYAELKGHEWFKGVSWDGLLSRQLEPPFRPKGETYAEDQEEGKGRILTGDMRESVAEDDQDDGETASWVDPDPSWTEDF
jgi:cGMP-dependent protein kinase